MCRARVTKHEFVQSNECERTGLAAAGVASAASERRRQSRPESRFAARSNAAARHPRSLSGSYRWRVPPARRLEGNMNENELARQLVEMVREMRCSLMRLKLHDGSSVTVRVASERAAAKVRTESKR